MEQYFQDVVSSLSIDDMDVMGKLYDNDATAAFKAMKHTDLQELTGLSEATYRKIIYRLIAIKFIDVITLKRQHGIYITLYGMDALKTSIKEVKIG